MKTLRQWFWDALGVTALNQVSEDIVWRYRQRQLPSVDPSVDMAPHAAMIPEAPRNPLTIAQERHAAAKATIDACGLDEHLRQALHLQNDNQFFKAIAGGLQ